MRAVDWIVRLVAAAILLQTLYFKFLGAEESVHIFTELGAEPWGRYLSGAAELGAAVMLLVGGTVHLGALLASGIMVGALLSHVFVLGIEVQQDGGLLFVLALVVLACSLTALGIDARRREKLLATRDRLLARGRPSGR